MKETFLTKSEEETIAVAQMIAQSFVGGETLLLTGDLGAGKTHFAKGVALGLGVDDVVTSPTFAIHNVYRGAKLQLNHFDFYRLEDPEEAVVLGLDELFSLPHAVAVIEWWQNVATLLPKKTVKITLTALSDGTRKIEMEK